MEEEDAEEVEEEDAEEVEEVEEVEEEYAEAFPTWARGSGGGAAVPREQSKKSISLVVEGVVEGVVVVAEESCSVLSL